MAIEKIKACPFCGRMARLIETDEPSNRGGVCVECHSCKSCGPVVFSVKDDGRTYAVYAWNQRVPRAAETQLLEACKEQIIRLTDLFNRHERPTYANSSNPDDDLALLLKTSLDAIAKAEAR